MGHVDPFLALVIWRSARGLSHRRRELTPGVLEVAGPSV
jgi:hypothetical protein